MSFLEMSLTGGFMALAITVLRAVLLNRLSKRTFVALWEITMLRLVLPFSIPAVTNVYSLFSAFWRFLTDLKSSAQATPAMTASNLPAFSGVLNEGSFQFSENPLYGKISTGTSVPFWRVLWLAGMVILFAYFAVGYIIIYRRYRYATLVRDGYVAEWLSEQKLRRKVRIYRSDLTHSPLTYGVFRPKILLPENLENTQSVQLTYILTHEMTHIRRMDMLRKIAAAMILCIHWFHPMVWVLYLLYNRDIELACDEAVVRKSSGDCRSAYAMTLIGMEERRRGFSSLQSHFSKNATQERIVAIMKIRKKGIFSSMAACALLLSVTCGFATSASAMDKPEKNGRDISFVYTTKLPNDTTDEISYCFNGSKSLTKLENAEASVPNVAWWTYDAYRTWLEQEKIDLQGLLGEKGWTRGRGDFVWTQEIIDETIAMYEDILAQIKNGAKVSKSVEGDESIMLIQSAPIGSAVEMSVDEQTVITEISKEEVLEAFGKYGISFDENDKMRYNGELVRFFCDGCEIEIGCWAIKHSFYNENGTIDVYAVYEATSNGDGSVDTMGKLVGLRKATEKEFEAANFCFVAHGEAVLSSYDETDTVCTFGLKMESSESVSEYYFTALGAGEDPTTYAVSISDPSLTTGTSFESLFSRYKEYGVEYQATAGGLGNVYFHGELVKKFYDQSSAGVFSFESTDGGKLVVATVYDGNGNLIGIEEASLNSFSY